MPETTAPTERNKRILSAIQPTGIPTLGNYLGALKNWAEMSDAYDCAYAVADLHALTVFQEPGKLRKQTLEMLALLLAVGLDPERNVIFVQSQVPAHAQLAWLLNCNTQFGELSRMTQFKDKAAAHADNVNAGLFTYPALMAADILLYQADFVPIGADQKQHLELARNVAIRFNNRYGDTFTVPEPYIGKVGARVMSLQEPLKKMSKSDSNANAFVSMLDDPDTILRKFRRAVTDSQACVRYEQGKDGINNLMGIYTCCTGESCEAIERTFSGRGYGDFKVAVAEAVIETLRPVQETYHQLIGDPAYLKKIAAEGAEKAQRLAQRTLNKAMKKVGLLSV